MIMKKENFEAFMREQNKNLQKQGMRIGKHPNSKKTQFKKGNIPYKKGKTKYDCKSLTEVSSKMKGNKNPMWKGDLVGNNSLHEWIKNHKPKPEFCDECGNKKPYDLANISGEYKRDVNDFEWLCRKCHMEKDGRMLRRNIKGCFTLDLKPKCQTCGTPLKNSIDSKTKKISKYLWETTCGHFKGQRLSIG